MRPASTRSSTASGRTSATSPTRPRSTSSPSTTVLVALGGEQPGVLAGEPDGERAVLVEQPDELALTWPTSTIRTTSIASGVVTRSPPWNSLLDAEPVEHRARSAGRRRARRPGGSPA